MTKPGPTGEFPEGKLNEHDEGALNIAIHVEGDTVMMFFNTPVEWLGLGPADARHLAELLLVKADLAEKGLN